MRKPRSEAARFTGLGSSWPPRVRRRSGWVSTSATSWPASTSPRSGVTASAGVPRKTRRTAGAPRSERGTGAPRDHREVLVAERPQRALALVRLEAVEQQHAVEVVDLVLEQPGEDLVGFDLELVPVQPDAAQRDHLGPDDLEVHARHRQAPLVVGPLPGGGDDLGVDDRVRAFAHVVGEDPPLHADLRSGQADAHGLVHRLVHGLGQRGEAAVDVLDLAGALLQHGIPEQANRGRSQSPTLLAVASSGFAATVGKAAVAATEGTSEVLRRRRSVADQRRGHTRSGSTSMRRRPRSRAGVRSISEKASDSTSVEGDCTSARAEDPVPTGPSTRSARTARIVAHATSTASGAPLSSASPPNGGNPSTRRRARSASATTMGSAARAASITSWSGTRVCTSTRPGPRRPPTIRAARTSSHSACSAARYLAARSSWSNSRNATTSVRSASASRRCRTASVPTSSGAGGSVAVEASTSATPTRGSNAASSSRRRATPGRRPENRVLWQCRQTRGRSVPQRGHTKPASFSGTAASHPSHWAMRPHRPQTRRWARPRRLTTHAARAPPSRVAWSAAVSASE